MMLLAALLTAWLCTSILALPGRRDSIKKTSIPLKFDQDVVVGTFDIGDAKGLSLVIGTEIGDILLNQEAYQQAAPSQTNAPWPGGNDPIGTTVLPTSLSFEAFSTTVSVAGLTVATQVFFTIQPSGTATPTIPHDGVFGLALSTPTATSAPFSFVANLCMQKQLQECKFGLALDICGSGSLNIGWLDTESIVSQESYTNFAPEGASSWGLSGTLTTESGGEANPQESQTFFPSAESFYVVGSIDQVDDIFTEMKAKRLWSFDVNGNKMLHGTYGCDYDPLPTFEVRLGTNPNPWKFDPSVWRITADEGRGMCTAPIVGWEPQPNNTWLLGQTWLRGKYLDFDLTQQAVMVAGYNKGSGLGCSSSSSISPGSTTCTSTATSTTGSQPAKQKRKHKPSTKTTLSSSSQLGYSSSSSSPLGYSSSSSSPLGYSSSSSSPLGYSSSSSSPLGYSSSSSALPGDASSSSSLPGSTPTGQASIGLTTSADDVVVGSFVIGKDGTNYALVVATHLRNVLLNNDDYTVATGDETPFDLSGGNVPIGKVLLAPFQYTMRSDTMSTPPGLEVTNQSFGYLQGNVGNGQTQATLPQQGVFGLAYWADENNRAFIANLCVQKMLKKCLFGLKLDSTGSGNLYLGEVDQSLIKGKQTTVAIDDKAIGWSIPGGIQYDSLGSKAEGQTFLIASEVFSVVGPYEMVKTIFQNNKINPVEGTGNLGFRSGEVVFGSYACDSPIPDIKFTFGSDDTQWRFDDSVWTLNQASGTCTAPILGWKAIQDNTWLLGQTWLRGKYVNFDIDRKSVAIANLNDDRGQSSSAWQEDSVKIPMRNQDGYWLVDASVGDGTNVSLRVDTISSDLIMMQSRYKAAQNAKPLNNPGTMGPLMPLADICSTSESDYKLFTDKFSVGDIEVGHQTIVDVTNPDFPYDASNDAFYGFLGLSGKDQSGHLDGSSTPPMRNMCHRQSSKDCRFGIALNATSGYELGASNTVGALFVGEPNINLLENALSTILLDESRAKVSNNYIDSVGQWWVKGDLFAGDDDQGQSNFRNQWIYFDVNSPLITGPSNLVSGLFMQLTSSTYRVASTSNACGKTEFLVYYDCSTQCPISIMFEGLPGKVPLSAAPINFGPDPGNDTGSAEKCSIGIKGVDMGHNPYWSFGYPWFHSRYVDFNIDANTVGFSALKDDVLPAPIPPEATSTGTATGTSTNSKYVITTEPLTVVNTVNSVTITETTGSTTMYATTSPPAGVPVPTLPLTKLIIFTSTKGGWWNPNGLKTVISTSTTTTGTTIIYGTFITSVITRVHTYKDHGKPWIVTDITTSIKAEGDEAPITTRTLIETTTSKTTSANKGWPKWQHTYTSVITTTIGTTTVIGDPLATPA